MLEARASAALSHHSARCQQAVLPDVDVAEVVRSHPRGFLSADLPDLTRTIATNVSSLQASSRCALKSE